MNNKLWLVSIKARVLEGSPLAMDGSAFMFGECATFSESEDDVKKQLLSALQNIKLELVDILHISLFEDADWVSQSESRDDILELIDDVKGSGDFSFGMFRSSEFLAMDGE